MQKQSKSNVDEHLERLNKFKRFCHEFKDHKVYGAIAGMIVPDNVSKYVYRQGLFVIAQNGENMEIKNDERYGKASKRKH